MQQALSGQGRGEKGLVSRRSKRQAVLHPPCPYVFANTPTVCGIRSEHDLSGIKNDSITPIDIAGNYVLQSGRNMQLDPKFELLRDSKSNSDASREGVRIELHGGRLPFEDKKAGTDQRAIIEFVCDKEREGDEGGEKDDNERADDGKDKEGDKKDDDKKDDDKKDSDGEKKEERLRRRDGEGKGKCEDSDASLRFCGYDLEDVGKDKKARTLRLEWRTKYACEDAPAPDGGSHWGFFTWFIIM